MGKKGVKSKVTPKPGDLEKVIDIARADEKGSWFVGGNKFELRYVEFEVSEGDKWIV